MVRSAPELHFFSIWWTISFQPGIFFFQFSNPTWNHGTGYDNLLPEPPPSVVKGRGGFVFHWLLWKPSQFSRQWHVIGEKCPQLINDHLRTTCTTIFIPNLNVFILMFFTLDLGCFRNWWGLKVNGLVLLIKITGLNILRTNSQHKDNCCRMKMRFMKCFTAVNAWIYFLSTF